MFDFDSRPQVRNIIIGWTLRFDDILDADKLGVALSQLLEIGDWRKLGGRLRRRVSRNNIISRHRKPYDAHLPGPDETYMRVGRKTDVLRN